MHKILCPAKLNTFLLVVGKRQDGYHLLQSHFALLDLHDTMLIEEAEAFEIITPGTAIETNICTRVYQYFKQLKPNLPNLKITIHKNIPMGGGLGGGSSNAASLIKHINKHYNFMLTQDQLIDIALKFGADVPFFIGAQNAIVEGIGEIIKPIDFGLKLHLLLVNPGAEVSTSSVFKRGFTGYSNKVTDLHELETMVINGKNDLEANAIAEAPQIFSTLQLLRDFEGCLSARMSGSGASCFALFNNPEYLKQAYLKCQKQKLFCHHQELLV